MFPSLLSFPPAPLTGIGFFYKHQCTNAMNAYHYWDSPLKKGDKGGCFSTIARPSIYGGFNQLVILLAN